MTGRVGGVCSGGRGATFSCVEFEGGSLLLEGRQLFPVVESFI